MNKNETKLLLTKSHLFLINSVYQYGCIGEYTLAAEEEVKNANLRKKKNILNLYHPFY